MKSKKKSKKEETVEERLERFEREYQEILSRRTEEDTDWTFSFVKNYVERNAPFRQDYDQEGCLFDIGCAMKDSDYEAKDEESGERYQTVWSNTFVTQADIYYKERVRYSYVDKVKELYPAEA